MKFVVGRGLGHEFPGTGMLFMGLDLDLHPGETVAVTGPSGSGKSTLLSILAGWLTPTQGSVERHEISHTGWVLQNPHGVPRRSAIDHVVLPLLARGFSRDDAEWEARNILRMFHLRPVASRPFRALSGGEAQRLMLARAVATADDLLLVDEPTAQLDLGTAATVNDVLAEIAQEQTIVVVATHDPRTRDACTRVIDLTDYQQPASQDFMSQDFTPAHAWSPPDVYDVRSGESLTPAMPVEDVYSFPFAPSGSVPAVDESLYRLEPYYHEEYVPTPAVLPDDVPSPRHDDFVFAESAPVVEEPSPAPIPGPIIAEEIVPLVEEEVSETTTSVTEPPVTSDDLRHEEPVPEDNVVPIVVGEEIPTPPDDTPEPEPEPVRTQRRSVFADPDESDDSEDSETDEDPSVPSAVWITSRTSSQ